MAAETPQRVYRKSARVWLKDGDMLVSAPSTEEDGADYHLNCKVHRERFAAISPVFREVVAPGKIVKLEGTVENLPVLELPEDCTAVSRVLEYHLVCVPDDGYFLPIGCTVRLLTIMWELAIKYKIPMLQVACEVEMRHKLSAAKEHDILEVLGKACQHDRKHLIESASRHYVKKADSMDTENAIVRTLPAPVLLGMMSEFNKKVAKAQQQAVENAVAAALKDRAAAEPAAKKRRT